MVFFPFNEKKGSRLRISRGFKRLVGEVARFFRVLTAEARTYRIFGAVRRVEIVEVSRRAFCCYCVGEFPVVRCGSGWSS